MKNTINLFDFKDFPKYFKESVEDLVEEETDVSYTSYCVDKVLNSLDKEEQVTEELRNWIFKTYEHIYELFINNHVLYRGIAQKYINDYAKKSLEIYIKKREELKK